MKELLNILPTHNYVVECMDGFWYINWFPPRDVSFVQTVELYTMGKYVGELGCPVQAHTLCM